MPRTYSTKDPVVLLQQGIDNITTEAKHDQVPLWRVKTVVAKVLMISKAIYEENDADHVVHRAYEEHIKDHVAKLLKPEIEA